MAGVTQWRCDGFRRELASIILAFSSTKPCDYRFGLWQFDLANGFIEDGHIDQAAAATAFARMEVSIWALYPARPPDI